jgi:hypothetical protein
LIEKQHVCTVLKDAIAIVSGGYPPDYPHLLFNVSPNSSLDLILEPGRELFQRMRSSPEFIELCSRLRVPVNSTMYVDGQSKLHIKEQHGWATYGASRHPSLGETLSVLADLAQLSGGAIFPDATISVEQWLLFNGLEVPETHEQTSNLWSFLNFTFPDAPVNGNYWSPLLEEQHSFSCSAEHRTAIRNVTRGLVADQRLLDVLKSESVGGMSAEAVKDYPDETLHQLLNSHVGQQWAQRYIDALGWFGSATEEVEDAQKSFADILLIAILLDLVPEPEKAAKHLVAEYDLYQTANFNRSFADVRVDVEHHLSTTGFASGNAVPLAAHLLLALSAPEFLVEDLPDSLLIGSVSWVALRCDAQFVEHCLPGVSRVMGYPSLSQFGEIGAVTAAHQQLREFLTISPILDWASLNGIIAYEPNGEYGEKDFTTAHEHFKSFSEGLTNALTALSTPAPSRRELTGNAMRKVLSAGDYLEQENLKFKTIFAITELPTVGLGFVRQSLVDFHMSGDLMMDGRFSPKLEVDDRYDVPAEAFTRLHELPDPKTLFEEAFAPYYDNLQAGLLTLVKLAFSQMPDADRVAFENGYIDVFTVREKADGIVDTISSQETQKQRDAAKGRFGLILCANYQSQLHSYELFPLQGLCSARPELAPLLRSTGIYHENPSLGFVGDIHAFQEKVEPLLWPIDAKAYVEGRQPRAGATSRVIVEKLYEALPLAGEPRHYGSAQTFFSARLIHFAQFLLKHHPVATREQLYNAGFGVTEMERLRAKDEKLQTAVVNVLVPFRQCIVDLNSGDPERFNEGVGGCVLDGVAIIGTVMGAGAKIAGTAGKTASAASKMISITKTAVSAGISLFNPADGVPSLIAGGYKLLQKGRLLLSPKGIANLETAIGQMRYLTRSTQTYDLARAVNQADVLRVPALTLNGKAVDIFAVQHAAHVYALNLRSGKAWGPRLTGYKLYDLSVVSGWGRVMPNSYARNFVNRSLPIARSKLETAYKHLRQHRDDPEVRTLFKSLFGSHSPETISYFKAGLSNMLHDMESLTMDNILFKANADSGALAELSRESYDLWLKYRTFNAGDTQFLTIHSNEIGHFYRKAKYHDGRIADELIREMSYADPRTMGLVFPSQPLKSTLPGNIDITPLMQFGNNPARHIAPFNKVKDTMPAIVRRHPALINAHSTSVMVSLLDQRHYDKAGFARNLQSIELTLGFIEDGLSGVPAIINTST